MLRNSDRQRLAAPTTLLTTATVLLVGLFAFSQFANGQDTSPPEPELAAASDEATQAIDGFKLNPRLECELFAAEPNIGNPVALFVDQQGRVFVCETYRQVTGVEDNREHANWLDDDLAAQSVADRIAYMKKFLGDKYETYTENDDRIRLLLDSDGDGKADRVTVFANGFNAAEMGTGAGVLSYNGNTYYTCIPSLFLLKDNNDDGVADAREILHTGFGVRFAFRGHDMHGLIIGPDGRLYFSIGDRGYNIEGGKLKDPASGAVFRCELDGSHLEVIATGLRNPQELAFDNYGNLFTGDNNSDSGDKARWVYIVPGGDSGWRMYYQYMADRGPFNREKIWHPYNSEETPAYIVPPIANFGDGPSGLTFYPGTGFGDLFQDTFLLCDFRGNASNSGIRSIRNEPAGAFFKIKESGQPIWQTLATDIDFGPDGKLYMADWVFGWVGENKGRVYTFSDRDNSENEIVSQVAQLLADGVGRKSIPELVELLSHRDRRVRQEAQFELVRKQAVGPLLNSAVDTTKPLLHRLHAIWGLGQLSRMESRRVRTATHSDDSMFNDERLRQIRKLLDDAEPEIRGRVCEFLGDFGDEQNASNVIRRLADDSARVRYFAALAIGKIGSLESFQSVEKMLTENMDRDPILRHAGIMAFTDIARRNGEAIAKLSGYADSGASPSVRLAACVALRKLESKEVAAFLSDEPPVQLEAARAIYDTPIVDAMTELAAQIRLTSSGSNPFLARVLYANAWLGKPDNADAIATFAANQSIALELRIQAVQVLRQWANPPKRDPFMGQWRPRPKRERTVAAAALANYISELTQGEEALVDEVVKTIGALKINNAGELLQSVVTNPEASSTAVANSLESLFEIKSKLAQPTLDSLIAKFDQLPPDVAQKVVALWIANDPEAATNKVYATIYKAVAESDIKPRMVQALIRGLSGNIQHPKTEKLILMLIEAAKAEKIPAEARLDVVVAASASKTPAIKNAVEEYQKSLVKADDPNSAYTNTLVGGDIERGRKIFFGKTEVSCVRCHKIDGIGGEVGPNLSDIGATKTRQYLLESIVQPNKEIAEGFAQTIVMTDEGLLHTGIIKSENENKMVLMDADGKLIEIEKDFIEGTKNGQSSMPADLIEKLTRSEVRDLIEYLKAQTSNEESAEGHAIQ